MKGSCEGASCIRKSLESKKQDDCTKSQLFADRCVGQNYNRFVLIALHEAFVE